MSDFLDVLAGDAKKTIRSGYYQALKPTASAHVSLKKAILECKVNPVIAEIKAASPSAGTIRKNIKPSVIAKAMEKGGAVAISVLTEPKHFNGSLNTLVQAREAVKIPILMKDIILSPLQLEAASKVGANAVLLIQALFDRGYSEKGLEEMIAFAHSKGLEVLLETHTEEEFLFAIETNADFVGINNRNLGTLKVDLNTTRKILEKNSSKGKIIISESGINTPADIHLLHESGACAFLVGSAIMLTDNVEEKVKELVNAK
jgi:indole-3-glycerol phosphate synthase